MLGDRDIRRTLVADLDMVTDPLDPARDFLVAQTRLRVVVSQGELHEARHQLFVEDEILEHTPYALGKWWNQLSHASLAFIEGRLEDADRWNDRALAHATDTGQPDALTYWAGVTSGITRDQGGHEDRIELGYRLLASSDVVAPGSVNERLGRAMLGVLLADAGRHQEAQEFLDAEFEVGFLPTRTGGVDDLLVYLHLWAEIAASLGARRAAAVLFDRMLPAAGAFVTTVTLFYGALTAPSVASPPCWGALTTPNATWRTLRQCTSAPARRSSWRAPGQIRLSYISLVSQPPTRHAGTNSSTARQQSLTNTTQRASSVTPCACWSRYGVSRTNRSRSPRTITHAPTNETSDQPVRSRLAQRRVSGRATSRSARPRRRQNDA